MKNFKLKNMVFSAFFIALGMVLPFITWQNEQIGSIFLLMHIPVFLAGLICGEKYGFAVGFIVPLFRSFVFEMPKQPMATSMAFELATYALVAGYIYRKSPWKCTKAVYKAIIPAMIAGRCVFGISRAILLGVTGGGGYTFAAFIAGSFIEAVPGIIIQLVLIPAVMVALGKARLVPMGKHHEGKKCKVQ